MTREKVIDIIDTMLEYGLIDPVRALTDQEYLVESILMYIESANMARKMMHMSPLV